MLIGRLCHASIDCGICGFGSTFGLASVDGSQISVWPLALEDEIPQNYENRSNNRHEKITRKPVVVTQKERSHKN